MMIVEAETRFSDHRVGRVSRGSGLPIKQGSHLRAMSTATRRLGSFRRLVLD